MTFYFRRRATGREWIDVGKEHYTPSEYHHCLKQLGRVGRFLGGDRANFLELDRLDPPPRSILDIGCGGGQFALRAARRYPHVSIKGIDIDPEAIDFARQQQAQQKMALPNLSYEVCSSTDFGQAAQSVDVVITTLTCHHLSDDKIVSFIQRACQVARQKVMINDLQRHVLAWVLFALTAPVLFPSRLILHDGLLSIRKGFSRIDWQRYLSEACPSQSTTILSRFAFRWFVTVHL